MITAVSKMYEKEKGNNETGHQTIAGFVTA